MTIVIEGYTLIINIVSGKSISNALLNHAVDDFLTLWSITVLITIFINAMAYYLGKGF